MRVRIPSPLPWPAFGQNSLDRRGPPRRSGGIRNTRQDESLVPSGMRVRFPPSTLGERDEPRYSGGMGCPRRLQSPLIHTVYGTTLIKWETGFNSLSGDHADIGKQVKPPDLSPGVCGFDSRCQHHTSEAERIGNCFLNSFIAGSIPVGGTNR